MASRELATLLEGGGFFEGPRWRDGRWWVSDFYRAQVMTVQPDGSAAAVMTIEHQPSGLGWMPDGSLLAVSMKDHLLLRRSPAGAVSVHADLAEHCGGHLNDMVVDARGRAYVGEFGFDLQAFADPAPAKLMRVDPDGAVTVLADDLLFPNGAVISPDGGTLIIGETAGARYTAFTLAPDGSVSARRIWAQVAATPEMGPLAQTLPKPEVRARRVHAGCRRVHLGGGRSRRALRANRRRRRDRRRDQGTGGPGHLRVHARRLGRAHPADVRCPGLPGGQPRRHARCSAAHDGRRRAPLRAALTRGSHTVDIEAGRLTAWRCSLLALPALLGRRSGSARKQTSSIRSPTATRASLGVAVGQSPCRKLIVKTRSAKPPRCALPTAPCRPRTSLPSRLPSSRSVRRRPTSWRRWATSPNLALTIYAKAMDRRDGEDERLAALVGDRVTTGNGAPAIVERDTETERGPA